MEYLKRAWNVILFITIWISIPLYLELFRDRPAAVWGLLCITWLPAMAILMYLNDDLD